MHTLMLQQGFVIAVARVDDDQSLVDGEASSEPEQAGDEDYQNMNPVQMLIPTAASWGKTSA
jgi:hypothetical protein